MRTKADILKEIQMVLVDKYYGYTIEKAVETTKNYHQQTPEALLHILSEIKARLPRLKLSHKMLEIPMNSEVEIRVLPVDDILIKQLKRDIRERVQSILNILDSKDYKIECDRFGDVASDAETIGNLINECEAIDWDEDF